MSFTNVPFGKLHISEEFDMFLAATANDPLAWKSLRGLKLAIAFAHDLEHSAWLATAMSFCDNLRGEPIAEDIFKLARKLMQSALTVQAFLKVVLTDVEMKTSVVNHEYFHVMITMKQTEAVETRLQLTSLIDAARMLVKEPK